MTVKGYALAIAASLVSAAGGLGLVAAFITGEWRWLLVSLVAFLLVRGTWK